MEPHYTPRRRVHRQSRKSPFRRSSVDRATPNRVIAYSMDSTFITQGISKRLEDLCSEMYSKFLDNFGVAHWGLTIIGSHDVHLNVTITDPNGRKIRDQITNTLAATNEIERLLERCYQEWHVSAK